MFLILVELCVSRIEQIICFRMYKDAGLYGGHVIMLGPGNENAALTALNEFPNGFQIGGNCIFSRIIIYESIIYLMKIYLFDELGGITNENALKYIKSGASHIIVTSYVFREGKINFDRLKILVNLVGKDRLVLN